MKSNLKIKILGCGGAGGVPSISSGWGSCNPNNIKNQRLRSSIYIEHNDTKILVDASPDLREQFLNARIRAIDAVIFTHGHADHSHGISELREVNRVINGPLDIWGDENTLEELKKRYNYAFEGLNPGETIYKPWLITNNIYPPKEFIINDLTIKPFYQIHGNTNTIGYRFKNFAYTTDLNKLTDDAKNSLYNLDLWIIGCLTDNLKHKTHVSVTEAIEWVKEFKPKKCIISHMGPTLDYDTVRNNCLPHSMIPAYDGLIITV